MKSNQANRNSNGSSIPEFACALVVFVCFVLAPLVNSAIIPARYILAQAHMNGVAHRMARMEKRSDAYREYMPGPQWKALLTSLGIKVRSTRMSLVVCGKSQADRIAVKDDSKLAGDWLPDGNRGPCVYALELAADVDVPPLFNGSAGLPAVTKPLPMTICARAPWDNVCRNPQSGEYYINE